MAESISTQSSNKTQRSIDQSEIRANEKWPGGLQAMLADYQNRKITIRDITRTIRSDYRAVQRLFSRHGISFRETKDAGRLARKLNPAWNENISKAKLLHSFRHPDHVTAAARDKRLKLFREHPERHGNAHVAMTKREKAFAELLESRHVPYHFNHHSDGYWLDFFLPEQSIGIEIQKTGRVPTKERDAALCLSLNLHSIIYIPNTHFDPHHHKYLVSLLHTIILHHDTLSTIGDARHLMCSPYRSDAYWFGFGFKNRWPHTTADRANAGSGPNPNPGIGGTVGNQSDSV